MTTTILEREDVTYEIAEGDADPGSVAHIVWVPPGAETTPHALVLAARIEGFPIQALCGHTWVPSKDPQQLPVCQPCKEIYDLTGHEIPEA